MYQALYRKYRSQRFDDMVGQTVISTTLKKTVDSGKISHAYLFSGPRGTGKTSAAKIFAKAMNCPNQVDGEPCNQCDICHDITKGSLDDVIEIDAASNNGVDEIRDIRDKSTYAPSRATYKVYIIDEVHMLSTGAFNALLKTLEEPTENVVFILATTELHKIPATILSRVQRFEFKAIKLADIRKHMASVLDEESVSYDKDALTLIARRAEGGMRDALSILDQALSLSTDQGVSREIAEEITGSISLASLDAYVESLMISDTTAALNHLEIIFDQGKSMSRFVTDLLQYLRDLLIVQSGGENTHISPIFEANLALEFQTIFDMIDVVTDGLQQIKQGTHPKIYAEMLTIRLSERIAKGSHETHLPDDVWQQFQEMKNEIAQLKEKLAETLNQSSSVSVTKPTKRTTRFKVDREKIITIMQETVEDSEKSRQYLEALKTSWNEILDSITPQNRALLLGSEPVLANSENAILAFDAAFNAEQVMKRTDLNDIFGNIMSKAAGFSPNIMAVPKSDFNSIRTEFAKRMKSAKQTEEEEEVQPTIPENFAFLSDKISTVED
ncbi:DNA polymerase III subunit gamma/tau [Streptococcus pluranimalium]|uniref:DNA polymerase III subunit gamma/tau n=1 Tax=Streptococcus pluranimalium TaxID=82348 RepID=UPI001C4B8483|nr:DNA polymerase III subunit gamma/tau [Streptococcus pluranimalium]